MHADDLNDRSRQLVGEEFSVQHLANLAGAVLAAEAFAVARDPTSKTARRREEALRRCRIGQHRGVTRGSYVDPRVITGYKQGITIAPALRRIKRQRTPEAKREIIERTTARMIKRVAQS